MRHLAADDPEVAALVRHEASRLSGTIDLIASESLPPASVMEAQGSVFTVKTVEGYPGRRFHAGCAVADELERLGVERARRLFGAGHANLQPHTGVSANLAVYFSVLEVGDRVLAMELSHGGHLSHGHRSSITGRCFRFAHYHVSRDTERIDYDEIEHLAWRFQPRMIVAGSSTYTRLIDYGRIARIAEAVSAYVLVDMAHIAGLVAAGVIPSPVPHSDFVTFTTYKTMGGGRGGVILCRAEHAEAVDRAVFPGCQGTPFMNLLAAKAVCLGLAAGPVFAETQRRTLQNAARLASEMERRGYRLVHGGTENHIVLLDLRPKGLTGAAAETTLESVGILTNRNTIPYDPEPPRVASGLRLGTAAVAARGLGPDEMGDLARLMDRALTGRDDPGVLRAVAAEVSALCTRFPTPAFGVA